MSSWIPKPLHGVAIALIVVGYVIFFATLDTKVIRDHLWSWTIAYALSGLVFLAITYGFAVVHKSQT